MIRRRRNVDVFNDPELLDVLGEDPELLAIADAIAQTQGDLARFTARRRLVLIAATVGAVMLIAVPAIAALALTDVIDFSGSPRAPRPTIVEFASLDRGAPPNLAPHVIAREARRLTLPYGSRHIAIYLAPTRKGGYCYAIFHPGAAGCDTNREVPFELGFGYENPKRSGVLYGIVLESNAAIAQLETADGVRASIPLTRVSNPIDASFFAYPIGPEHEALPLTVELVDSGGTKLGRRSLRPFVTR